RVWAPSFGRQMKAPQVPRSHKPPDPLGPCLGHNASRRGTSIGSPLEPVSGSVFSRWSHQRERVTWKPTASPRSSTRNTYAQMPGRKVRPGKPRDRDEALMTNVGTAHE